MNEKTESANPEGKENTKLENYRLAIKDARHIFNTYREKCPPEAWECLKKILFNDKLK